MSDRRNRGLDLFSVLLIGGAIGAALSLLYAPQSGKKLRKDLRKKSRKLRREAEAKFESAQHEVEELLQETRKKAEQLKMNIERTADGLAERAGNLIEEGKGAINKVDGMKDWAADRIRNMT